MIFDLTYKGEVRTEQQARLFFARHQRIQKKIEMFFIPKIKKAIENQIQSFIDAIKTRGFNYAKHNIFSIVSFVEITMILKELYRKCGFIEGNFVINYIRSAKRKKKSFSLKLQTLDSSLGISIDDLAPVIDRYFEIYVLNRSALPITATTRKYIINHLVSEVDGGKDLQQALDDFTALAITEGREYAPIRAKKIALTETTKALSFGGLIGAYMTGIDVDKVWVTCDDERVRDPRHPQYIGTPVPYPHTVLDLNEAELLGSFYNGERIKFPGDPEAHISNTANCRCALYYKEKDNAQEEVNRKIDMALAELFANRHN